MALNMQRTSVLSAAFSLSFRQVGYGKYDLTPVQVQWLMYQLICGLNYLHSMGVMHRDLAVSQ